MNKRFFVQGGTCSITTITPASGPVGTPLSITGSSFGTTQGSSTITIGGVTASPSSWSATQINVSVPNGATVGAGSIVINMGGNNSCNKAFTVTKNCLPGSVPDCNGVCGGPSLWDCGQHVCYNPNTGGTPSYGADCAGKCFQIGTNPVNKPDCAGKCFGVDTPQGPYPRNAPDCKGVCWGTDLPNVVPTVYDCNGVCGGGSYYDCSGHCIPNNCVNSQHRYGTATKFRSANARK